MTIDDFNGDGLIDLVIANRDSDNVSVLLNQCTSVLLGDVSQDGVVNLLDVDHFIAVLGTVKFQADADCN